MQRIFLGFVALLLAVASHDALAEFPDRPIRILLPAIHLSGDNGFLIQEFAPFLAQALKVNYEIETFPNSKDPSQAAFVAFLNAPKNGYTLMYVTANSLGVRFGLNGRDQQIMDAMEVIDIVSLHPLVCVTQPNSPYRDWKHFFNILKTNPRQIRHVYWNKSATLYSIFFMRLLGVRYERVNGSQISVPDHPIKALHEDRSDFTCWTMMGVAEKIKSGEVAPIFSNGLQSIEGFREIPLARNIGLREAEKYLYWGALVVPKGTPEKVVQTIRGALKKINQDPAWKKSNSMRYGVSTIGKFPDPKQFIEEQNDFFENLVILSKITQHR